MPTILLVENDKAWVDKLEKLFSQVLGETAELLDITTRNDDLAFEPFDVDSACMALVDLELGPGTTTRVSDFGGRDRILPALRDRARWLPIVLVTQYISGDETLLADLTVADFDAILTKSFFTNSATNPHRWQVLKRKAAIRRIASLTGRFPHSVESLLDRQIVLECGRGVKAVLDHFGLDRMQNLIRLLDFGAPRLVIDEVVQGHSGVVVLKITCSGVDRSTKWLLKCGTSLGKLDQESQAHHRLFIDGFTRKMSVPLLHWAPVVWEGIGGIAYEFEEGSETLLDVAVRDGVERALQAVLPALNRLFGEPQVDTIIPRSYLREAFGEAANAAIATGIYSRVSASLLGASVEPFVDRSLRLRVGCQHGDLHSRNVLLTAEGPVLIDFAHYVQGRQRGIPLLDIAKLALDLRVFAQPSWSMEDLFSGQLLSDPILARLAADCGAIETGTATEHEKGFFAWAACCIANRYLGYPDVKDEVKELIVRALCHTDA